MRAAMVAAVKAIAAALHDGRARAGRYRAERGRLMGQQDPRIISYMTLRQAVGYLGVLLPFVLALGNGLALSGGLQQSLSDYYHTGMRGVLVGALCVIGAFLLAYHGYDRWDSLFSNAAGAGAVGVALFPTPPNHPSAAATIAGYFHFAFGTVMFSSLIVMALWLFRKTDPRNTPARPKRVRDIVYLVCGIVMLVSLSLAGIASLPFAAGLSSLDPVFWMESTAVVAFGVSWLIKGQMVLRDQPPLRRRFGAGRRVRVSSR
jgi:hypothetical protein